MFTTKWQGTTELQYTKIPFLEWKFPSSVLISQSLFIPVSQLVVQKGIVGKVIMKERPTSFPYHPLPSAIVFTNLSKVSSNPTKCTWACCTLPHRAERPRTKLLTELLHYCEWTLMENTISKTVFLVTILYGIPATSHKTPVEKSTSKKKEKSTSNTKQFLFLSEIICIWFRSFCDLTCKFRFSHPLIHHMCLRYWFCWTQLLTVLWYHLLVIFPFCWVILTWFVTRFQFSFFPISCLCCLLWVKLWQVLSTLDHLLEIVFSEQHVIFHNTQATDSFDDFYYHCVLWIGEIHFIFWIEAAYYSCNKKENKIKKDTIKLGGYKNNLSPPPI